MSLGPPLRDRPAERRADEARWDALWAEVGDHPAVDRHPDLVGWLAELRRTGRLRRDPNAAETLAVVLDVLAVLPVEPPTTRSRLAANLGGRAHGLDDSRGRLVAAALAYLTGVPTPSSDAGRRALWAEAGVEIEPVLSRVSVLGLRPAAVGPLTDAAGRWADAGVALVVHLGAITTEAWSVGEVQVRVCENPAVLEAVAWAEQWPERTFALEDCRHVTRRLDADLLRAGEAVLRVPTRLMAGARRGGRERGKSDPIDALAVARAALREPGLPVAQLDGETRRLRLLIDHREDLVRERTRIQSRLRWHLHELFPGRRSRPRACTATTSSPASSSAWPASTVMSRRSAASWSNAAAASPAAPTSSNARLPRSSASWRRRYAPWPAAGSCPRPRSSGRPPALPGSGPGPRYASWNGTASVPVWSGNDDRHRLNRGGNRQVNAALHRIAITQWRGVGDTGRAYVEARIAEGHTRTEALRLLRRRLSNVVYRSLLTDEQAAAAAVNRYIREAFLAEATHVGIADLDELNDRFVAWAEHVANRRVHAETNEAPIERFERGGPHRGVDPERLAEAFRWSVTRKVTRTATSPSRATPTRSTRPSSAGGSSCATTPRTSVASRCSSTADQRGPPPRS